MGITGRNRCTSRPAPMQHASNPQKESGAGRGAIPARPSAPGFQKRTPVEVQARQPERPAQVVALLFVFDDGRRQRQRIFIGPAVDARVLMALDDLLALRVRCREGPVEIPFLMGGARSAIPRPPPATLPLHSRGLLTRTVESSIPPDRRPNLLTESLRPR
jgi:hypothetical protein